MSAVVQAVTSSEVIRAEVLGAIQGHPSLLETPRRRSMLLEALVPFAQEELVRGLAIISLESAYLKNSPAAVSTAVAILRSGIGQANESASLSRSHELRLLNVAARYAPGGGNLAAGAALHLVPHLQLAILEPEQLQKRARAWFVERHQEKNPWLAALCAHPTRDNVRFLVRVAEGRVPQAEAASLFRSLVRLPMTFHEIALTSAVVTVAARQICAYLKMPKAVSNATIAALSAIIVMGGKGVASAFKEDTLNAKRNWERVEAIARLASMSSSLADSDDRHERNASDACAAVLRRASRNMLQPPLVREAARLALELAPIDPVCLWNCAIQSGGYDELPRPALADIRR